MKAPDPGRRERTERIREPVVLQVPRMTMDPLTGRQLLAAGAAICYGCVATIQNIHLPGKEKVMRLFAFRLGLCVCLLFGVTAAGAQESSGQTSMEQPSDFGGPANFCSGTYALCIIAPCGLAIPTRDSAGEYELSQIPCSCDVVEGWNMGPGSCDSRKPVEKNGRIFLVSTYSNRYNSDNQVRTCGESTLWAWCYGAPCVIDEKDPKKAICNCPVKQSVANLVGDCNPKMCDQIWSAATPAASCFANQYFYSWMNKNGHKNANPPAVKCETGEPVCEKVVTKLGSSQ